MIRIRIGVVAGLLLLACVRPMLAQQANASSATAVVPTLVQFTGVLSNSGGKPATGITGVTFSLYAEQEGGAPLWLETQNVQPNQAGQYSVMLGSTSSQGLPSSVFVSGQARWLEVEPQGQAVQPRVMLLSMPYALKAGDAQTLGGKPASAFVTASGNNSPSPNGVINNALSGGGTTDYVPLWLSKSKLGSSNIFQSAAGDLGIGTTSPAANLDVNGTSDIRDTLTLFPNGSAPTLSVNGTVFQVSNTGVVSFASGQTFPGTATLGANTFTGNQTVNGNVSATGVVSGSGFQIGSNLFDYGSYANANAFLGFAGNTTTTGTNNTASGYQALFANTTGAGNTASGYGVLLSNTSGGSNTASGYEALYYNNTGGSNTASGYGALLDNTSGGSNTSSGAYALATVTTGSNNAALGYQAGNPTTSGQQTTGSNNTFVGADTSPGNQLALNYATALGANSEVTESNAMVLGSISGVNGCTSPCASTNVGIGTTTPAYTLDVHGTGNFTGLINFASGQTFPGTGTITGVTAGTGLSGGGSGGNVTLNNTGILSVTAGTGISSSGGQNPTIGINTSVVPQLNAANTFTGNQTVNGNLSASGTVGGAVVNSVSTYYVSGVPFDYGNASLYNAYLGFAGDGPASTGSANTASGYYALARNTSGNSNTASGMQALYYNNASNNTATGFYALFNNVSGNDNTGTGYQALANTTGGGNTASGYNALIWNTSGSNNTAVGYQAGNNNGQSSTGSNNTFVGANALTGNQYALSNATAIGASAEVLESNAMVLGSIDGVNSATASTLVGIGTTSPTYLLHIGNVGGSNYNNFLRADGPTTKGTGGNVASFGGYGAFEVDAYGTPGGRFLVTEGGLVGIGINDPKYALTMGDGAYESNGVWTNASDRNLKEGFAPVNGASLLAKLNVIPMQTWKYKTESPRVRHLGPMAQDFRAAFGLGLDDKHISTIDEGGVALAAVQELYREGLKKDATIRHLQEQIRAQQAKMKTQEARIDEQQAQIRSSFTLAQAQQAQIAELMSQVKAIQVSLKTDSRTGEVRTVKAQARTVQQ